MTDLISESSYMREIKDYFCSLVGRAIISSEDDYLLIQWKREGVPKRDVLLGIKKAFENSSRPERLRISGCSRFVEESFIKSRSLAGGISKVSSRQMPPEQFVHSVIAAVSRNVRKALAREKDDNVKRCLEKASKQLSRAGVKANSVGDFLETLRDRMCRELVAGFDLERTERVNKQAREAVSGRSFINKGDRKKALAGCLNEIIMRESGLDGLFSSANGMESEDVR